MIPSICIIQLPHTYTSPPTSAHLASFAVKSRALRLQALQTSAHAFSSTHERELAFAPSVWQERLTNPAARTFIALDLSNEAGIDVDVDVDLSSDLRLVDRAPWVGSVTVLGPRVFDGVFPDATTQPWELFHGEKHDEEASVSDDGVGGQGKSLLYMVNAVYVGPGLRGAGVGKKLLTAALEAVERDFPGAERVQKIGLIMVDKDNLPARKLYESCGFWLMGEQTYTNLKGETKEAVGLRLDLK